MWKWTCDRRDARRVEAWDGMGDTRDSGKAKVRGPYSRFVCLFVWRRM